MARAAVARGPAVRWCLTTADWTSTCCGAVTEALAEAFAVGWVRGGPVELALGFGVRGAADLGHHRDPDLTGGEAADPYRHVPRRLRADRLRQRGQPARDGHGLVVGDVVDAGGAMLDR